MGGWNTKRAHAHRMRDLAAGHVAAMADNITAAQLAQRLPRLAESVPGCTYIDTRPAVEDGEVIVQFCQGVEILLQRRARLTAATVRRLTRWAKHHQVTFTAPGSTGHECAQWE